jgi:hypothetical protein
VIPDKLPLMNNKEGGIIMAEIISIEKDAITMKFNRNEIQKLFNLMAYISCLDKNDYIPLMQEIMQKVK